MLALYKGILQMCMPTNVSQQCKYSSQYVLKHKSLTNFIRLMFLLTILYSMIKQFTNISHWLSPFLSLCFWTHGRNIFSCPIQFSSGHRIVFHQRNVSRSKVCALPMQQCKSQAEGLVWVLPCFLFLLPLWPAVCT